mmetsp:Transcript_1041/g.2087  ORF Transcript_1041/g.2087 Transcript_1041/m.2087 type:complete len:360 (-) Transcript_1041:1645-2724(-)
MVAATDTRVRAQVVDVDRACLPPDYHLQLACVEHSDPLDIDDVVKPAQKCVALCRRFAVELEVGGCRDILEEIGVGHRNVCTTGYQLCLDVAAISTSGSRERKCEVLNVAAATRYVLERHEVAVHLWVERVKIVDVVNAAQELVQEKAGKSGAHEDFIENSLAQDASHEGEVCKVVFGQRRGCGVGVEQLLAGHVEKTVLRVEGALRQCIHEILEEATAVNTGFLISELGFERDAYPVLKVGSRRKTPHRVLVYLVAVDGHVVNGPANVPEAVRDTGSGLVVLDQSVEDLDALFELKDLRDAREQQGHAAAAERRRHPSVLRWGHCVCQLPGVHRRPVPVLAREVGEFVPRVSVVQLVI